MAKKTGEGILYPENAQNLINTQTKDRKELKDTLIRKVPHKSWSLCKDELDKVFTELSQYTVKDIFLLSPLHEGPVISDKVSSYTVYTYEGEKALGNASISEDDDICSEEFSLEIILPYLDKIFPSSSVHAYFAPEIIDEKELNILKEIVREIRENYKSCLILLSDNSGCCSMWEKALTSRT